MHYGLERAQAALQHHVHIPP